ncbi:hypothetical protein AVEN_188084-1 [Araneus ventricosus]|uniref:Uncharacterized protein n=1 Tax=Araneus ventricosus TaxID=182803 RepID=A0A4Y2BS54_ARAVE|nr:hypothetical protein AVEN_188084-1 [Araneus ventricosus]
MSAVVAVTRREKFLPIERFRILEESGSDHLNMSDGLNGLYVLEIANQVGSSPLSPASAPSPPLEWGSGPVFPFFTDIIHFLTLLQKKIDGKLSLRNGRWD